MAATGHISPISRLHFPDKRVLFHAHRRAQFIIRLEEIALESKRFFSGIVQVDSRFNLNKLRLSRHIPRTFRGGNSQPVRCIDLPGARTDNINVDSSFFQSAKAIVKRRPACVADIPFKRGLDYRYLSRPRHRRDIDIDFN